MQGDEFMTNGQYFRANREIRLLKRNDILKNQLMPTLIADIKNKISDLSAKDITKTTFGIDVRMILKEDLNSKYCFENMCENSLKELLPGELELIHEGIINYFSNQDVNVSTCPLGIRLLFDYNSIKL